MAITLVPLATARIQLRPPIVVERGPLGTRQVFEVASLELSGDRLRGTLKGVACADWLLVSAEGAGTLDVRGTIETHDGAIIYLNYYGKTDLTRGLVFPVTIFVAPRFETGDPRYAWLNTLQAVGKGIVDENLVLTYEWYELA